MSEVTTRQMPVGRTEVGWLEAAFPLVGSYVVLCMIYVVEAWKHVTPWLFGDELELTQLSRSIANTGRAARRGAAHSPDSIYTYATAPFWLIDDVAKAYSAVKYLDVFVMASVIFPTYFLARLIVGRGPAYFAAAGAALIPSVAYSAYILEEPFAYPYAALCLFAIAKMFVERERGGRRWYGWTAAAAFLSLAGAGVKGELVVLIGVFVLAVLFMTWSSDWMRARRKDWSLGDWLGVAVVVLGAIFLFSGVMSHHSIQFQTVTRAWKHRIIVEGDWAVGSLALGLGIVPLIAGLASLFDQAGERRDERVRAFRCTMLAGLIAFGTYTAMKAAYLSTTFATRVEERNIIYISPLLFVGTALVLERRRVNLLALAGSGAYALYLVGYAVYHAVGSPYELGVRLYSDALGFSIAQRANLDLYWNATDVRIALVVATLVGTAMLLAPRWLGRQPRAAVGVTAALALTVLAWNLIGEISAAADSNNLSTASATTLQRPFTWLDDATHLKPTLYMGASEQDQNPEWLLEFWNRSITRVSSLDGTVGGPGPAGGPNLLRSGVMFWSNSPKDLGSQYEYAVEDRPCVDLAGTPIATHHYLAAGRTLTWTLLRLTHPNRLKSMCTGISPDGWTGANDSAYFRFSGPRGWLRIVYSRRDWGYASGPTGVHILLGKLIINANDQPILGRVTREVDTTVNSAQTKVAWLRVPAGDFSVHVVATKKVVPNVYDPSSGDRRPLGVELTYTFVRRR